MNCAGQIFRDLKYGRTQVLYSCYNRFNSLSFNIFHLHRINSAFKGRFSPQSQHVGSLMRVCRSNKNVSHPCIIRDSFPDINHIIIHETYCIKHNNSQPCPAVINHHCPGPQIIVNTIGRTFVSKACYPHGIKYSVPIAISKSISLRRIILCIPVYIVPPVGNHRCDRLSGKASP